MDITLSLNGDSTSIDVIKYCALYFDHITIDRPIHIHTVERLEKIKSKKKPINCNLHILRLFDITLFQHTKMLEDEGIIKYASPSLETLFSDKNRKINDQAKNFVGSNIYKLFPSSAVTPLKKDMKKSSITISGNPKPIVDEAIESYNNIFFEDAVNDLIKYKFHNNKDAPAEFYCLLVLYSGLFEDILHHICKGEHIVSNSAFINQIMQSLYIDKKSKVKKTSPLYNQIALNCMSILLPHVKDASMEDILELRFQAKDELYELKNYIDTFMEKINVETILELTPKEINTLIEQKITPAVNQFERKMKSIRITAIQNAVRNPVYYVPLITSAFSNLPQHIMLLSSLSLIALDTILEYRKNINNLKNDALYFTLKFK